MKKLILMTAVLFAGICNAQFLQNVDDFSKIKIDADAQVEIVYSSKSAIAFNKNESEVKGMKISSENDALIISQNINQPIKNLKIRIYTNDVKALAVNGKSTVVFSKFKFQDTLVIMATQGAEINTGDMVVKNLNIVRSENSNVLCKNARSTKETVDGVAVAMK